LIFILAKIEHDLGGSVFLTVEDFLMSYFAKV